MRRLTRLKEMLETWTELGTRGHSLIDLLDMASGDHDEKLERELSREVQDYSDLLADKEFQLTLSGPYDDRTAIVSVHAGAGGVDSQDWTQMLLRMYLRWSERKNYKSQILDVSYGEESGIKSATVEIQGYHPYGYLKSERGVHRLVRLSPFDSNHLRHTSFSQVEVIPAGEEDPEIVIRSDDIKIDFFRSSGPGGQNVQKVASAVRISHLPTGIVVACQNERSQHQNREFAMTILKARILQRKIQEQVQEMELLRGEYKAPAWGNQIRSYTLHPYKLVKDHRTEHQNSDPETVLDGDLDRFLEAYLLLEVNER